MKKSLMLSILFIVLAIGIAGCGSDGVSESAGSEGASKGESVTLRLGHVAAPGDSYDVAAKDFAKEIEGVTDGRVKIELFGNAQLGGERELTEQIQQGTLDMGLITSGPVTNFVPELAILDLPFLFRDKAHFRGVLDSEIGDELSTHMLDAGLRNLGFWENGTVHIANNIQEIESAKDLDGLSLRTLENEIIVDTYRELGADPTAVPFPEAYTSLQQGVVDGFDSPYLVFSGNKFYEVQDYLSEVGIFHRAAFLLISDDVFKQLDSETQDLLVELGEKHTPIQRELNDEMEKGFKQKAQDNGVEILNAEEVDRESFESAVEPVYEKHQDELGEMVEKIRNFEE